MIKRHQSPSGAIFILFFILWNIEKKLITNKLTRLLLMSASVIFINEEFNRPYNI